MVDELSGCFIKLSKSKNLPVTRYFILNPSSLNLLYFKTSSPIRKLLKKSISLGQALNLLDTTKSLNLKSFSLSPKQDQSFSILVKGKNFELFPWFKENFSILYSKFQEISSKISEFHQKKITSCSDQSTEKQEIITLQNGNTYCGELNEEGLPHGNSFKEFCEDGSIFYGSFRNGKWHGSGFIISARLDIKCQEYINGKLCGI